MLKEKYNLLHLSTGESLREEIAAQTELGKKVESCVAGGQLVSDAMIIDLLDRVISRGDSDGKTEGMIFDGFPRTVVQAEALEELMTKHGKQISLLIDLVVEEEELVTRMLKRGQTSGRTDDNMETIKNRLSVYHEKTKPVIDFYKERNKYVCIEGIGTINGIFERICETIDKL